MSKKSEVSARKKYIPLDDTRRFSDGIRIHPYVDVMLWFGRHKLNQRHPDHVVSAAQFSRATLPILKRLDCISLVEPLVCIPDQLSDRDRKLAKRGGKLPIWMPTWRGYKSDHSLWNDLVPVIKNQHLVWCREGKMLSVMPRSVH